MIGHPKKEGDPSPPYSFLTVMHVDLCLARKACSGFYQPWFKNGDFRWLIPSKLRKNPTVEWHRQCGGALADIDVDILPEVSGGVTFFFKERTGVLDACNEFSS